jgi:hypothetical protein
MSYRQLSSRIRMELQFYPDPAAARKLYDKKHVEFHSKINLRN